MKERAHILSIPKGHQLRLRGDEKLPKNSKQILIQSKMDKFFESNNKLRTLIMNKIKASKVKVRNVVLQAS